MTAGRNVQLRGCACCGIYNFDDPGEFLTKTLTEVELLKCSPQFEQMVVGLPMEYRCAHTTYTAGDVRYHLHRKFVDGENVCVCRRCWRDIYSNKIPPLSLKDGQDYGDLESRKLPNPIQGEILLIARARLFIHVVKLTKEKKSPGTQDTLSGHIIAFAHDALEKATDYILPRLSLTDQVEVKYIGTRAE